jgi:hypothetical protein
MRAGSLANGNASATNSNVTAGAARHERWTHAREHTRATHGVDAVRNENATSCGGHQDGKMGSGLGVSILSIASDETSSSCV